MAAQAESAFARTFLNTLSTQPVTYADDYQQPPEYSMRRVPVLSISVPPPPERKAHLTSSSAPISVTFKSLKPPASFTLSVQPAESIAHIKAQIATQPSAPPADIQRLLLKGKALADAKLLKEYAIKDGDTVNLMIKPGTHWDPTAPATPAPEIKAPMATTPSNPFGGLGGSLGTPGSSKGKHQRIPSVVLSPSPSNETPGAEKDITLTLDVTSSPVIPSATLSTYHEVVSDPEFWLRMYTFLCQEFKTDADMHTAFEDFLCAAKGSLSAFEIARIRDTVGIRGMAGAQEYASDGPGPVRVCRSAVPFYFLQNSTTVDATRSRITTRPTPLHTTTTTVQMVGYLASFGQLARVLLEGRKLPIVPVPKDAITLYSRPTPLFARLAYIIIAIDVMAVSSVVEYTWGIGDKAYALIKGPRPMPEQPAAADPDSIVAKTGDTLQHQSLQKKILFSGMFVFSGALFAAGILGNRARILTALQYVAHPKGNVNNAIYLRASSHPEGYALRFPIKKSALAESRAVTNSQVYTVQVEGHGAWAMDLVGAEVLGKSTVGMTPTEAITSLRPTWRKIGGRDHKLPKLPKKA
ncbi:hypothetical protein D9619_007899 [Psilocybe cf. subviscida]|uniref:Ubiquitin-like domain-containing protein n=1 Tax=Psilocybe cf. subviscida TaxID=2480587 RepID=A0A8H5AUD8_9AGAR|nr:hypothetical protein D9619_007899 [Psilocybe cf. subviscida]